MKKFGFILGMLIAFAVTAIAQPAPNPVVMTNPNGLVLDTASSSTTVGPFLQVKGPFKTLTIVIATIHITDTIAGTIAWQGCNDGVNYATISTTALVNKNQNYQYKEVDKGFLYYRALPVLSAGTLSYKATLYTTNGQ